VGYGYNHGRPITEVDADAYIDRLDELAAWRATHGQPQVQMQES
jgi:hypothetical protein